MKNNPAYVLIIVTFLIWGTQHPCLKILSNELPPFLLNFVRFSFALLVLAPLMLAQRIVPSKNDLVKISLLGVVGVALYGVLAVAGFSRSTAVNGSILLNSHPILAAVVAAYLFNEKLHLRGRFGIFLGFLGMCLVVTNGFHFATLFEEQYFIGNLLLLLSAVCLGLYALGSMFFVPKYGSLATTFYAVLAGTLFFLIAAAGSGQLALIRSISLKHLSILLYIAVVTTALAWVVWFKAIEILGVSRAEPLFFLLPISGVLSSHLLLGEEITVFTLSGAAFILIGVYMVQTDRRKSN